MSPEEQVAYGLAYFGRDPRAERILVQVISRLADEAREFALDCRFFSVGGVALGTVDKLLLTDVADGTKHPATARGKIDVGHHRR